MLKRVFVMWAAVGLLAFAGCGPTEELPDAQADEAEEAPAFEGTISSVSPVTTPDDEEVGESSLEREADRLKLEVEACCLIPGNAYTIWWGIGDVTKSMSDVSTPLAIGWVAESEELAFELELESGGVRDMLDGVRIWVLDHGPDTGEASQLTSPSGGCLGRCPVAMVSAHPAPPAP